MNIHTAVAPDYEAIKTKQNAAWGSGDYAVIGNTLQIVGEQLAEALDMPPPSSVLDVAAGNGNATLAFARRWHQVTSTDYVQSLLESGKRRALADGFNVDYRLADAEDLPFDDGSFDAVVSTFGVMFAPNQSRAAEELARVCRSGGKIGMANWTPDSFIGRLFKVLGSFVAPPPGVMSPANWGDEKWLRQTFGETAAEMDIARRDFVFRYQSPKHFVDVFRTWYGPVHKAFATLDAEKGRALEGAIIELVREFDVAADGTMAVPSAYLEVSITKR